MKKIIFSVNTDDIFSPDHGSSTERLVDGINLVHGSSDQRGAGVSNSLAASITETGLRNTRCQWMSSFSLYLYISELDTVHGELPVSLSGDGDVGEVSRVVFRVAATQDDLAPGLCRGVPDDKEN